jgi:hypothetical protein
VKLISRIAKFRAKEVEERQKTSNSVEPANRKNEAKRSREAK